MKVADRLFGVVFIVLGLGTAAYGWSLPKMMGQPFGAGLFPLVVGCCLAIAGCGLVAQGWAVGRAEPLLVLRDWGRSVPHLLNLTLTICLILAFAFLMRQVGFAVLSFATICLLLWRFGQPVWRAAVIGLVSAGLFQIVFVSLMRVPLPAGLLEGLIR